MGRQASSHASTPIRASVAGVCPVLETPFARDGAADAAALGGLVDRLGRAGVPWVMYPGFASEHLKLTDMERDALTEVVIQRSRAAGLGVVASVADHGTSAAVARAERYAGMGADAINVLPPHQLAPSAAVVRAHLEAVLSAIAPIPVILQYAPAQTGSALDADAIAAVAERAPNLVHVKADSSSAGRFITALAAKAPRLTCIVGYAGLHLPDAWRRGAVGVQPGCSFVELYLDIWHRWSTGDESGGVALHARMVPYLAEWMQHVELIVAVEKRISYLRGLIPTDTCRAPGWQLDAFEWQQIDRFLDEFADELAFRPVKETSS